MTHNMSSPFSLSYLNTITTRLPPSLRPFFLLSYPVPPSASRRLLSPALGPAPTLYGKGPEDVYFTISCALGFTILREICVRYILRWFALLWLGPVDRANGSGKGKGRTIKDERERRRLKRKRQHVVTRFAEQGWSFLYCSVFWSMGMLILRRIPNATSPAQLWGGYPFISLPGLTKFYYLAQLGWWFHQIYVIHSEKPRKDHWQMFTHHILTIALIVGSYVINITRVGTLIHVLMDFCDILLPLAKMLRYLGLSNLCDLTFVVFLVGWLLTRQVGLFLVIRSIIFDLPQYIPYRWDPSEGFLWTRKIHYTFIGAMSVLLCLATMWFYLACMVAIRVVRGMGAEDSRSDDEDEESPLEDVPEVQSSAGHITKSGDVTPAGASTPSENGNGTGNGDLRKRR
ncbi:hypothetical protein JCM24511_04543 [Saitozyma sp. JCM 24511]|nr:hypothetical protein JCM24511_04543 [Saitozyma sp. JCM 24511]